jgi:hypothetical protein
LTREQAIAVVSRLAVAHDGVFRGRDAVACGVNRNQLGILVGADVLERVFPDTYRVKAVGKTNRQALRGALLFGRVPEPPRPVAPRPSCTSSKASSRRNPRSSFRVVSDCVLRALWSIDRTTRDI